MGACCKCRWLRQTLQAAATADASHLLDINVHLTKAVSRSQSYASLSKVRRRRTTVHGGDRRMGDKSTRLLMIVCDVQRHWSAGSHGLGQ
jgi:hypothetical protein